MSNLEPQIFGAIIGAGATAVISILVVFFTNLGHNTRQKRQHAHDLKLSERRYLQQKIEEMFYAFSRWETNFSSLYIAMIGYVSGELSESDACELVKSEPGHKERVDMLISLYFPQLNTIYGEVMERRGKVVQYFPLPASYTVM